MRGGIANKIEQPVLRLATVDLQSIRTSLEYAGQLIHAKYNVNLNWNLDLGYL